MPKATVLARHPLRIAQVAPPVEPVPPVGYGGTERVVGELVAGLVARGHDVTLFASGDSTAKATRLSPTIAESLRSVGDWADAMPYTVTTILEVLRHASEFDVIHAHLDWAGLILARVAPVPVVLTFHGRLDQPWAATALTDPPGGLVAISHAQASSQPDIPWAAVIHNGLDLGGAPFVTTPGDALCFVGRIAPEKGVVDAIEVARLSGRTLRIAAKVGWTPAERAYHDEVFQPALARADVEYLGELSGSDRDRLFAESHAMVMPGGWPEPFGLVAIESLACGTPVLAYPTGALPEIVRDGVDGFFGDDPAALAATVDAIPGLDRRGIRRSVLDRFSADRMTAAYEELYVDLLDRTRERSHAAV
ncbi:MAG TPA: glycosyltransferase family 4 protein [Candidatus Acidoferrum sp.]|nr:glycosyltransferase family 4 protein [Candidatus Acidoferrum sp.]